MNKKVFFLVWLISVAGLSMAQPFLMLARTSSTEGRIGVRDGVYLNYITAGKRQGTPVIFLHGYTDSWHSFRNLLELLPDNIYGIAITLRGHGESSKPAQGYHPKDFAADVAAFMEKMHLPKAVIAGHSMGGVVAQQFALDYPQMVDGLIIISSDANFSNNPGLPEFRDEISGLTGPVDKAFAEAFQKSTIAKPIDPNFIDECVAESMKTPLHVWKASVIGLMTVDFTAELRRLQKPALILWGEKDTICSRADQDAMLLGIGKCSMVVYENNGHALHWEDPEKVARDIVQFVRSIQQIQ